MIFIVLAGLRELLRRVEATLPRGRRLLLESLDSALALAERTATTVALNPASPPLAALSQSDQEQGQGRDGDGVLESESQSVIARLFFLLPQVMVIFTTMMVVVIGLLISVPAYPLQTVWRAVSLSSSRRTIVPTPLTIALWLRSRRLLLRGQALEDAVQTSTEQQIGDDESATEPEEGHRDEYEMPSTSSGRRVSYSPTTLADYAAKGQGPCPEHPSGYMPLAFLVEPLNIGSEDSSPEPSALHEDEHATEKFGGEAKASVTTEESRAVAPFSVAPAAVVAAAAAAAEPVLTSADAPPTEELAEGTTESTESTGGGSSISYEPGPSRRDEDATSGERPSSVVGSVVSLADLASAMLNISSPASSPSPSIAAQPGRNEKRPVSETPSDPPAFIMPGTPSLSMEVDLPLLQDALSSDLDMSRSEQKDLRQSKSEESGGSKSSSRPLSSHSSLEQSEKLEISDDESCQSETPQIEDLDKTVIENASPDTEDKQGLSDSPSWTMVHTAGEKTSHISTEESKGSGVDDKLPKE